MKSVKCVCFIAVLLVAGLVNAGSTWYGLDAGDVWSDASNWIGDGLPGSGSWVDVQMGWTQPCLLDSDAGTIGTLHVGVWEHGGTMTIKNGGNLTVSGGDVAVGWNRTGTLTIETGGSLTANCLFTVGMFADEPGSANLILDGGTLTVNNAFYHGIYFGSNIVDVRTEINAGVLDVDALILDRGVMNITNGTVIVAGDVLDSVSSWIAAGRLTAFDGAGTIVAQLGDGYTQITAIPEPATLVLLALGTLTLRRKK